MILVRTLSTPFGLKPRFLSKVISRQENASRDIDLSSVQSFFGTLAKVWQRSKDDSPKRFDICLQPFASTPEGSESPLVFIAAVLTSSASIGSNLTT